MFHKLTSMKHPARTFSDKIFSRAVFLSAGLSVCATLAACCKCPPPPPPPAPCPQVSEAPKPAPEPKESSKKKNAKPATLARVQSELNKRGAKIKADGKAGPKTTLALQKFQKHNGLKVTGKADKPTLTKLGLA